MSFGDSNGKNQKIASNRLFFVYKKQIAWKYLPKSRIFALKSLFSKRKILPLCAFSILKK